MKNCEIIVNQLIELKNGNDPQPLQWVGEESFDAIISAINDLAKDFREKRQKELEDKQRLNDLQDILFLYLARDFSQKAKVIGDSMEIDALALSINYFGEELAYNFEQLIESEKQLKEAQHLARVGSWHLDLVNSSLFWSEEMKTIFEAEDIATDTLTDFYWEKIPKEDAHKLVEKVKRAIEEGESYQIEHRIIAKDGSIKYLFCVGEAVRNEIGEIIAIKGVAQDISDRNTIEQLRASEERLKAQQEKLLQLNAQLQSSEEELKTQQEELIDANRVLAANVRELEQARIALDIKAKELEIASNYKSEFLANMSHELRTPLNSIMILSKLLQGNKEKNLSPRQIEFASVIQKSGSDLLKLINDVLDLAKVESGKIEINIEKHEISTLVENLQMTFQPIAAEKGIKFLLDIAKELPLTIETDLSKLDQIVKNLLSNAFKFTEKGGSVSLSFRKKAPDTFFKYKTLVESNEVLEIQIEDTGIGIPKEKQGLVFLAFHQGDGTTQRKYGGTGLGLSISRELANLLGGEIHLKSEVGKGSIFSVYLPLEPYHSLQPSTFQLVKSLSPETQQNLNLPTRNEQFIASLPDDRDDLKEGDKIILIVEDDLTFAKILLDFAREKGFKGIVVNQGDLVLQYVQAYLPQAIFLDIQLPVVDGWTVLQRLRMSEFAHLPIHIISGTDRRKIGLSLGAVDYLVKPVSATDLERVFTEITQRLDKAVRHILVVEDDKMHNMVTSELVNRKGLTTTSVYTGRDALLALQKYSPDLVILDLGLPDMKGMDLLAKIKETNPTLPVIVFTAADLNKSEIADIQRFKNTPIVIKSENAYQRLLEELEIFTYHINKTKDNALGYKLNTMQSNDFLNTLSGKTILIVDDDDRNVFALQTILEQEDIRCLVANNGIEAVKMVKQHTDIEAVLMDVMMPEMDGYEATKHIRALGKTSLPIIGLTAKAMKGDREKCLEAGLSDYLSKPINVDQLFSLLNTWLHTE
ncbi:MAG: response regulator [Bacteroidia bacterium]